MRITLLKLFTFLGLFKEISLEECYARKCSITGIGINRGYICGDLIACDSESADQICISDGWQSYDQASHFYHEIYYFSSWIPNGNDFWGYNKNGKKRILKKEHRLGYELQPSKL